MKSIQHFHRFRRRGRFPLVFGSLQFLLTLCAATAPCDSIGGGWLHGGADAEYFASTDLSGDPAFTRRDVRVDFDWGTLRAPGGSSSPGYSNVAADSFSVRWTGQIMARFTEVYQFELRCDDGARLFIRPAASGTWTTLLDHWSAPGTYSASVALTAGQTFDLRLEYRELTGAAACRLRWSSPSTPPEVLDSVTPAGINLYTYASQVWANAMDGGRDEWRDHDFSNNTPLWPARDSNGWPLGDGVTIVWEGADPTDRAGTYLLSFTGRADVTTRSNNGYFRTGETAHGLTLLSGEGYDAATNTTSAYMDVPPSSILYLNFTNTRRNPGDTTPTGVSDVKLMRPIAPGSATPHAPGTLFTRALKDAFKRYSTLRWILNQDTDRNWSDRVLPAHSSHVNIGEMRHWEQMVMLSNETGKDLYLCLPVRATNDYITKVAQLLRYGSDGVNPYTSEQVSPVYPPLNPNLRMIVERENEVWNWSFANSENNLEDVRAAEEVNSADWQAVNYDGRYTDDTDGAWLRWHALRTVRVSQLFRAVFGDAAMGDRVRVVFEYQYDNANGTAENALTFLDNYFHNADGLPHVSDPHPLNYHLWGAGGAVYYGAANPNGAQDEFSFGNFSFESPALAAGTALQNPPDAQWTFTGTAGIYRAGERTEALTNIAPGPSGNTLTGPRSLGCRFTTGPGRVGVYELGRWAVSGNHESHELKIIRASDRVTVAYANLNLNGAASGQYHYARLEQPAILEADTSYYLMSSEYRDGDDFHDNATVTAMSGLTVNARVEATYGDPSWNSATWSFAEVESGSRTFGPVNLRCTVVSVPGLEYPPDAPAGGQAAWIAGLGEISQQIAFPRAGVYALRMQSSIKEDALNSVRFYFDSTVITPDERNYAAASSRQWWPGDVLSHDPRRFDNYSTFIFHVAAPATHTLRIAGLGLDRYVSLETPPDPNRYIYFDQLEIVSADAFFDGGIPGAGEANGQVASGSYAYGVFSQARYAQAYGLQVVAYEGGWSVGSDYGSTAFQNWCKHYDQRARIAQRDSLDIFARSGSRMYIFGTYETWPAGDTIRAASYPLTRAVDDRNAAIPPEPSNGIHLPAVLTPANHRWARTVSGATIQQTGGWFFWSALAPATAEYVIAIATQPGGTALLEVDGTPFGAAFSSGGTQTFSVSLTYGIHALKLRSAGGTFAVNNLTVTQSGAPSAPVLTSAVEGDSRVTLTWSPGTGLATDYRIRYGTAAGTHDSESLAGAATGWTITGLVNGTTYYFTVVARNAQGLSLPSNERGAAPVGPGEVTRLANWEFTGLSGVAGVDVSAAPNSASGNAVIGVLTRGPGLSVGYGTGIPNTFASGPGESQGYFYGQSFEEAQTRGQYYTFTVAPAPGKNLRLTQLQFRPYFQTLGDGAARVSYSIDDTNFVPAPVPDGTPVAGENQGALHTLNLTGIPALEATTTRVTFRIYLYGTFRYVTTGLGGLGDDLTVFGSYGNSPNAFDAWRALHGLAADGSADLENPAGDGVTNLIKFALNLAPGAGDLTQARVQSLANPEGTTLDDLTGLPFAQWDTGGHLRFVFLRRKAASAPGVSYRVEFSDQLSGGWAVNPGATVAVLGVNATWERVTITDIVPGMDPSRRFARLRIEAD